MAIESLSMATRTITSTIGAIGVQTTGKFDLSFHVVRACQIYANHGSVQCEHLAFSSLECYNPQNLINYYDMAGNDVNAEKNLPTGRRI